MEGWPDFIGVGAAKCGTTALYYYLQQHPEVWVPGKDSYFFSPRTISSLGLSDRIVQQPEYQALFSSDAARSARIRGEVASFYFHCHEEVIPRIQQYVGDPKILITLRNPAARAYSNYLHYVREMAEHRTFEEAVDEELASPESIPVNRRYVHMGLYAEPLEAFLNSFSDVKVLFFEQLGSDPKSVMTDLYTWLGVDAGFEPDLTARYNSSGVPRVKWLQQLLFAPTPFKLKLKEWVVRCGFPEDGVSKVIDGFRRKNMRREAMAPSVRQRLAALYQEDTERVEQLLGCELNGWKP